MFNTGNYDVITLLNNFLEGESFQEKLADETLNLIDRVNAISYSEVLKVVKNILNYSTVDIIRDVCFVTTDKDITKSDISKKELSVLIRYINLCHKNKEIDIILLNGEIIFIKPRRFNFGERVIQEYAENLFKKYNNYKEVKTVFGVSVYNLKYLQGLYKYVTADPWYKYLYK